MEEVVGPLDWRRRDLQDARMFTTQIVSDGEKTLADYLIWPHVRPGQPVPEEPTPEEQVLDLANRIGLQAKKEGK